MEGNIACQEQNPLESTAPVWTPTKTQKDYVWLFIFHVSSLWVERMFDFAAVLFISKIYTGTFLETSLYGLSITAAPIVLSSLVGGIIDSSKKIKGNYIEIIFNDGFYFVSILAVKIALIVQKAAIILSFISLTILAHQKMNGGISERTQYSFFYCLLITGAIMRLSTIGIKIGIERHWLAILTKNDSSLLASLNAFLRRLDLICGFFAPMFVSLISDSNTIQITSFCLIAWCIFSFFAEVYAVSSLYRKFPILAEVDAPANSVPNTFSMLALFSSLLYFIKHPLFLTSLALSMLFCNVLSFGGTMIAYFKKVGFSDMLVALTSGACTFTGIVGTIISPRLVRKAGLRWAGTSFLSQEVLYLTLVVIAIHLVPVHSMPFYLFLLAGTILARTGLCGFDLVQTQMIQEGVDFDQLGKYVGFQFGLQNGFELCQYGLTTIWSNPDDFAYPATLSLAIVSLSLFVFIGHGFLFTNFSPRAS